MEENEDEQEDEDEEEDQVEQIEEEEEEGYGGHCCYLSGHGVGRRLVRGQEGAGQLRLVGERRRSGGREVSAHSGSPRAAEFGKAG